MVAIGDYVGVALRFLKEGQRHDGATYELCSEGRFTAYDISETIGRVTGQTISVQEISADVYLTVLFGDGDRSQFAHQVAVLKYITKRSSEHDFVGIPPVITWLLGRRPTRLAAFVLDGDYCFKVQNTHNSVSTLL